MSRSVSPMDDFAGQFMREKVKREILKTTDPEQLHKICMALIKSNECLRSMLLAKMEKDLPMLDSTGL